MYQKQDPQVILQSFEKRIVSRYRCLKGSHDARTCGACLRAGVHTIVLETSQMRPRDDRDLLKVENCLALPLPPPAAISPNARNKHLDDQSFTKNFYESASSPLSSRQYSDYDEEDIIKSYSRNRNRNITLKRMTMTSPPSHPSINNTNVPERILQQQQQQEGEHLIGITPIAAVVIEPDYVSSANNNNTQNVDGIDRHEPVFLRWMLFVDESNQNVNFVANNSYLTLNTLFGATPLPPHALPSSPAILQQINNNINLPLVSAISFGHGAIEKAESIVLAPLHVKNPFLRSENGENFFEHQPQQQIITSNGDDLSHATYHYDNFDEEAALEFVATALSGLQDACLLSECHRPMLALQGQCVSLSGVPFVVQETIPAGCVVVINDSTCVAVSAPDPALEAQAKALEAQYEKMRRNIASSLNGQSANNNNNNSPLPRQNQQQQVAPTRLEKLTIVTPPPAAATNVTSRLAHQNFMHNNNNNSDEIIVSPPNIGDYEDEGSNSKTTKNNVEMKNTATSPIPFLDANQNNSSLKIDSGLSPILLSSSNSNSANRQHHHHHHHHDENDNNKNNTNISSNPHHHQHHSHSKSWNDRYLDLVRMWETRFVISTSTAQSNHYDHHQRAPSHQALFPTPRHLVEGIKCLAAAASALQECNNDVTMFLTRGGASTSYLLNSIPASTDTLIGRRKARIILDNNDDANNNEKSGNNNNNNNNNNDRTSYYLVEVLLILHPDPEQVCIALELEGIRVAECWPCNSSNCVYVAIKIKDNNNNDIKNTSKKAATVDQNEVALAQLFLGNKNNTTSSSSSSQNKFITQTTLPINGQPFGVTKLQHTVLDDLHRTLMWHDENVRQLYHQVWTGSELIQDRSDGTSRPSDGPCWSFIMDTFGVSLAELVRDIKAELNTQIATASEASDSAFCQVEEALSEFRRVSLMKEERKNHAASGRLSLVDHSAADAAHSSSTVTKVLEVLAHAVAHEVAGEDDLRARDGVLTMWTWFELLGTGYEQVVSKVPEFRKKLLSGQLEGTNEVLQHSLRSCYQQAVDLMRGCYHQVDGDERSPQRDAGDGDRIAAGGPRTRRHLEEAYFNQLVKIQQCLDELISTAQETDVFAGDLSVAELWSSDYRCFAEFLSLFQQQ